MTENQDTERKMTRKEWEEIRAMELDAIEVDYLHAEAFDRARAKIHPQLYAALEAIIVDESGDREAAFRSLDAAVVQLRDVYNKYGYEWDRYKTARYALSGPAR